MSVAGIHRPVMQNDEWLTPPEILAALGDFDLDPCAPVDRPWPTAARHYTIVDDGLAMPWAGRVWLNPPYGRQTVRWLGRLHAHGRGTALIYARTETTWFVSHVWGRASAALFLFGRLHFHYVTGECAPNNSGGPSVLVAYGQKDAEQLRDSGLPGQFVQWKGDDHAISDG